MTAAGWIFDAALAAAIVLVAWRATDSEQLIKAIALFVAFGLLMTIAWVRLGAPDVALAEAGIGAGFSGALFLAALARLEAGNEGGEDDDRAPERGSDDEGERTPRERRGTRRRHRARKRR